MTGADYSTNPRYAPIVKIRADFGPGHERLNCTGTFISPRHILTAAHCLLLNERGLQLHPVRLDYSTYPKMDLFWEPNSVEGAHVKFIAHPAYEQHPRPTNESDVGVIVLDHASAKTWLKMSGSTPRSGDKILVAGYGRDAKREIWSTDFQVGSVELAQVGSFLKIKRGGVEYGEGDSGGPALVDSQRGPRIVGIGAYTNLFKGALGLSRDRIVRVDPGSPLHAWVMQQLKR